MRIVQVVREIHPKGGSSGVAWHLREQFTALGIDNDVITQRTDPRKSGSKLFEKARQFLDVVGFTFEATFKIQKIKDRNTVVIVHNEALGGDIYVDHGLHKAVFLENPSMIVRNPIHLFLLLREEMRHRLTCYRNIVSLSMNSTKLILRHYPYVDHNIIRFIPNGIDLNKFKSLKINSQSSFLRVIFVGHEFDRKGLAQLLGALALLPDNVIVRVVGGGVDDIEKFRRLAKTLGVENRVDFLGRRNDVPELMNSSDLMIMPSSFEAWPLVVLEAMACGNPVLMTRVGGSEEMIHDGITGFKIQRESEDIARCVKIILEDKNLLGQMSKNCIEFSKEYSWSKIAKSYIDLAKEIVTSRK